MSFFSEDIQRARAQVKEEREQDIARIVAIRQQVADDIARNVRIAFISEGAVAEAKGRATMDDSVRGQDDSADYQHALRETEAIVAEVFADSGSEVTVECSLSSYEQPTGRWVNYDVQETVKVTTLNARATFEPPLT